MSTTSSFGRAATAAVTLLVVTSALAVAPAAVAAAEETEPNDSRENAQSIATGEEVTGTALSDDNDWFRFSADRGETINITATVEGDDAMVNLYDADGDRIASGRAEPDPNSAGTTALYSGTYYIRIDDFGFPPDNYSFTVETYETDPFEPSEDRGNATRIDVGTTQSGIATVGDGDWFRFEADRGETINITATVEGDDAMVNLYDADGDRIASGRAEPDPASTGTTALYSGTYYIRLDDRGFPPDNYSFTVETYETDPFEPNENLSMAVPLFDNPLQPLSPGISIGDDDYFVYPVEAGETIRANATIPADGERHQLSLYRPDDDRTDNSTKVRPGTTGIRTLTAGAAGPHYVAIEETGSVGPYELAVTAGGEPIGPPNDRFELPNPPVGNQDRAHATDLAPGSYTLGMVDDDRDVFALDLNAGERLIATAGFNHSANDIALALTDGTGTTLTSADSATDDERLAFTATEAGTHYLRVSGEAGAATRYDLDVTVLRQLDVTVGPGADSLDPGTTATYEVALVDPSAGLDRANLSLATTNTTVLRISDVTLAGGASGSADLAPDGSEATITATDLGAVNGTVPVATVTVAAEAVGEARLGAGAAVTAPGGLAYPLDTVQNTTVSVGTTPAAPDVTGDGQPATDPDGDGVYEDIDGDGSFDIFDVQAFLDRFGSAPVQDNSSLFNFDGGGGVNIFDVQALLDEV